MHDRAPGDSNSASLSSLTFLPPTARAAAWSVLDRFDVRDRFAADLFEGVASELTLPDRERGLAMEIALGSIRRLATLDGILQKLANRARDSVEPSLWNLLRVGLYQVLFCDGVPRHAAVHETVELARIAGRQRWIGFANGVLRSAARLVGEESAQPASHTWIGPRADRLPTSRRRFLPLTQHILPDPYLDFVDYIAFAFSLPHWVVARWRTRLNDDDALIDLAFRVNNPPETSVRMVRLHDADEAALMEAWRAAGLNWTAGPLEGTYRVERGGSIERWPGFAEGRFVVQDASAVEVGLAVDPQPGERVLDLCAAPGAKTVHLAELMRNRGEIIACDLRDDRLDQVDDNCRRLGIGIVSTHRLLGIDVDFSPDVDWGAPFDAVLIDAPCSNSGVLQKRPEARWRLDERSLDELSMTQTKLLRGASRLVRPGGRIVYSTCSVEPEENQQIVARFLDRSPDWRLVRERLAWPADDHDGGYFARLERMR